MKKQIIFTLVLLVSPFLIYNFYSPAENTGKPNNINISNKKLFVPSTNGGLDKFYVGAINDDADYNCYTCDPFTRLDVLGFNMWHQYLTTQDTLGRTFPASPFAFPGDNLFADVSTYAGEIHWRVEDINEHNGRKLIMTRPKIEYLCYGQRSDYQCENILTSADLWFYGFNSNTSGRTYIGSNETDKSLSNLT